MPQLDFGPFLSEIYWLILIFFIGFFCFLKFILPQILAILKIRNNILKQQNTESKQINLDKFSTKLNNFILNNSTLKEIFNSLNNFNNNLINLNLKNNFNSINKNNNDFLKFENLNFQILKELELILSKND